MSRRRGQAGRDAKDEEEETMGSDEDEYDEQDDDYDDDDDDDWRKPVKKRSQKGLKAGKKSSTTKRRLPRGRGTQLYDESDDNDDDDDDDVLVSKKRPSFASSRSQVAKGRQRFKKSAPVTLSIKRNKLPAVKDMVIQTIQDLKEDAKVGSTLGTIKNAMVLKWPDLDLKSYDERIKKYVRNALATGEIIQVRGRGLVGRFTVPGMWTRKKRRRRGAKAGSMDDPKLDVDEVEYKASKTERDEAREKAEKELEEKREQRRLEKEAKIKEKELKPKIARKRKVEFEVEEIRGYKKIKGNKFYLVKFEGYAKPQWEPEDNVQSCESLVEEFHIRDERRLAALEAKRKQEESEGAFEVHRILDVHISKKDNKRSFLIRWKGHGPEGDTWEPEENLSCDELILKFLAKLEAVQRVETKSLRVAPKKVERLAFAGHTSSRVGRRNQGFRVTYEGMDD